MANLRRADASHLARLQYAQQAGLKRGARRTQLVQKQGSAIRRFKQSRAFSGRAGECAFRVAEQLGFEQRIGQSRTVDCNEGPFAPRAEIMDRAGRQFLSGAGFAGDEDGRVHPRRVGDQFVRLDHCGAAADQPRTRKIIL